MPSAALMPLPTDELIACPFPSDASAVTAIARRRCLTYHVVPGKVSAADVIKLSSATTVEGQDVQIHMSGGVKINDANVSATDVAADNGVIHVIDSVILPN